MTINAGLQNFASENQAKLNDELDALFRRVLVVSGELASNPNATLSEIQTAINAEVDKFNAAAATIIVGLAAVAATSLEKVKTVAPNAKITPEDTAKIQGFVDAISLEFQSFTKTKAAELSGIIYQQIIAGASKEEIVASVKKSLESNGLGNQNLRGFKTIITTRVFELESFVTKLLVEKNGSIDRWKYVGGIIGTTRDWCRQHNGQTLTKKEIEAWRNFTWAGKKEGDPFVVRGGWNCRHHWMPVENKKQKGV